MRLYGVVGPCTCGLMITTDMNEGFKPLMAHQTKPQYFMACNSGHPAG